MSSSDARNRFSDRVEDYRKYRPDYPKAAIDFIRDTCGATADWSVADIGSGTGISTQALIRSFHCPVFAVEPNLRMREEAERVLGDNPLFRPVNGSSDETTLDRSSVNLVAAFQAFHWFDVGKTRAEWRRILRTPPWVVVVWNDRKTKGSEFLEGYEGFLQTLPEYRRVDHKNLTINDIHRFFGNEKVIEEQFPNSQRFDLEGFLGRSFSSSYVAGRGSPEYAGQRARLEDLFEKTNSRGIVEFLYDTRVYLGTLS